MRLWKWKKLIKTIVAKKGINLKKRYFSMNLIISNNNISFVNGLKVFLETEV